jgi:hypothetical protein
MLNITKADNFRRSVAGLSLILGPVVILVAGLVDGNTSDESGSYLSDLAEKPGAIQLSVILFVLSIAAIVVGILGAMHVVRGRGVVLAHVGAILTVFGGLVFAGAVFTTFYDLALAESTDRTAAIAVYDSVEGYAGAIVLFTLGFILFPIGITLVLVGTVREGLVAIWVPIVAFAGFVIVSFVGGSAIGELIGAALIVAALGYTGVKVLGMSDRQWAGGTAVGSAGSGSPASTRERVVQ